MTDSPGLPRWIVRPNGDREPFDAERVFRTLFRASERLGNGDAFRARELADAVLHFLAEFESAETISYDTLHDTVVKVVRELGHASLARASTATGSLAEGDLDATDIYPPEILAAEQCGLLAPGARRHPSALAGTVLASRLPGAPDDPETVPALAQARLHTARYVAIDSPEYLFRTVARRDAIREWVLHLRAGVRRTGLHAAVNLNCRTPPAWAFTPTSGLFPKDVQSRNLPARR